MKFFKTLVEGFKIDIDRYSAAEKDLEIKIAELEGQNDPLSIASLRTHRRYLNLLRQKRKEHG